MMRKGNAQNFNTFNDIYYGIAKIERKQVILQKHGSSLETMTWSWLDISIDWLKVCYFKTNYILMSAAIPCFQCIQQVSCCGLQ